MAKRDPRDATQYHGYLFPNTRRNPDHCARDRTRGTLAHCLGQWKHIYWVSPEEKIVFALPKGPGQITVPLEHIVGIDETDGVTVQKTA